MCQNDLQLIHFLKIWLFVSLPVVGLVISVGRVATVDDGLTGLVTMLTLVEAVVETELLDLIFGIGLDEEWTTEEDALVDWIRGVEGEGEGEGGGAGTMDEVVTSSAKLKEKGWSHCAYKALHYTCKDLASLYHLHTVLLKKQSIDWQKAKNRALIQIKARVHE